MSWVDPLPPVAVGPGLVSVTNVTATPSAGFTSWLERAGATLVVTTGDRLLTIGAPAGELVVGEHTMDLAVGAVAEGPGTLHVATRWQLHRFEDALGGVPGPGGEDRRLLNQHSRNTGFVGAYDLAVDRHGRVLFANTLCNGVSTAADRLHFSMVALPPFVSGHVAEERCHVTGLAVDEDGELAYLTCAAATDRAAGWRDAVADGGVLVDVRNGRILTAGLALPFSPRVHEGALYVAAAGTGELLRVDRTTGAAEPVVSVPGLARGLTFVGGRAVLGCSVPPTEGPYLPVPVAQEPPTTPRHGLAVVDLDAGSVLHTLTLEAGSGEVHAVTVLLGARRVEMAVDPSDGDGWFAVGETGS